jgi:hypothetical protein
VKPKTFAGYRHDIDHYIVLRIGRMRLQALRPAVISKLYRDLADHLIGYSRFTVWRPIPAPAVASCSTCVVTL